MLFSKPDTLPLDAKKNKLNQGVTPAILNFLGENNSLCASSVAFEPVTHRILSNKKPGSLILFFFHRERVLIKEGCSLERGAHQGRLGAKFDWYSR